MECLSGPKSINCASPSSDADDDASTVAATPLELSPASDARGGSDTDKAAVASEAAKAPSDTAAAPAEAAAAAEAAKAPSDAAAAPAEASGGGAKHARKSRGKGTTKAEGLPRAVRISKTLTQILRHRALDLGVAIRPDGYCRLHDVLAVNWLLALDCTKMDIESVVKESDKKRFDMIEEGGETMIRAAQGHSIKAVDDECLLRRLTPEDADFPQTCVHGTYRRHFEKIRAGGLLAGGNHGQSFRKHIHFVPFDPFDRRVISGMRFDCEVAIWIDLRRALQDGVPFYVSANQVILSPGIDGKVSTGYFLKAQDLKTGESLNLDTRAPGAPQQPRAKAKSGK